MEHKNDKMNRRAFLKTAVVSTVAATIVPKFIFGSSSQFQSDTLQVWSCGGLAESFMEANPIYEKRNGITINYTGAFAGALGKSLLGGGATTEVFGGRVLQLAKNLRKADKMIYFKPLCFTEYVMITPKGNPAKIQKVEDMAKPGVRVILPLGASPPGGDAVMGILKKAKINEPVLKNMIERETCVTKMMPKIAGGKGAVSIVERRLTTIPKYQGKIEVIPIDEAYFPPGPLTFTIGVMKAAKDRALADDFIEFIRSEEGQSIFQKHGFIPAVSEKGEKLIEKLGVKDV